MPMNDDHAALLERIDGRIEATIDRVVAWRRDIHAHPELSNREFRTAALVADHLRSLEIDVRTGVAHTGVVGRIAGGRGGDGVVALRADMDALPVTEAVDIPFASRETAEFEGQSVGVMHACGHDVHTAILMGVAEALAAVRDALPGDVVLLFQPAEEGAPEGEEGGAELMIREGALDDPPVGAVFGLHVSSLLSTGQIGCRPGSLLAAVDDFRITIRGRQTHGAYPWRGVDPIVVAAQVVLGLQTIPSRQLDVTTAPAVVTVGSIHGGVRNNIIPDEVELVGTIRTLDRGMRDDVHERVARTAGAIAESAGASAEVRIRRGYPVTWNDPELTASVIPALQHVAGHDNVLPIPAVLGAEDFAFYQEKVPGVFYFLGTRPPDVGAAEAAANHSPHFYVDETAFPLGMRSLARVAVQWLADG